MDVVTGLACGLSIMVFGSAGIVGFALFLMRRDAIERQNRAVLIKTPHR